MSDLQQSESLGSTRKSVTRSRKRERSDAQQDWTIKGLSTETVNVARDAARQSGMKINAWVNQALVDAATDIASYGWKGSTPACAPLGDEFENEVQKLRMRNDELVQTVRTLTDLLAKMYDQKLVA